MHKFQNMFFAVVSSALLLICVPACGDDGGGSGIDAGGDVIDGGDIDGGSFVCDPVGANAEVGGLLNAPVESDVEVIVKVPNHPGDPGPDNLP